MNGMYLIPANSKKSKLIFGLFTKSDLILFSIGLAITLFCMAIVPLDNFWIIVMVLAPALVTGFLVVPVPNYHNVRTFIKSFVEFFTTRQNYFSLSTRR